MHRNAGRAEVIAHRGASAYAPEHTYAAYDLALEMGADRLELDVHPSADGEIVVNHDATLRRTTGDPRAVADMTAAELLAMGHSHRPLTLGEVFARYGADTRFLVEIKDRARGCGPRLLSLIAEHGLDERVVIQSFDRYALRPLRRAGTPIALAPLYRRRVTGPDVRRGLHHNAAFATAVVACTDAVDATLIAAAHARGVAVHTYTVNDEAEAERLLALGVDGLITDVPDRMVAVRDGALRALAAA